ncbi:MAG: UDP-N-acetylglucosamine 1-carboxyvinyltransferase [Pelagibacteraceae bacterium]|nr:UDP-N-acetylglucosamine 1-carboxyvinyltransferase [Pelagibacteraceae bacterium]
MDKLIIKGNADLKGSIKIKGSKNAALPIIISSLLSNETLKLKNIPKLDDIKNMIKLLRSYGSTIKRNKDQLEISCKKIINKDADYDIVRKMRASILILGPLISRFGTAKISLPGGCAIGTRPIDIHLEGLKKLGANFSIENGYVVGQVKNGLVGNHVPLSFPSVGATENIMMASTLAKGKTIIENAAMEPEIFDLAGCLNKMGAKIKIKNNGIIQIDGVSRLVTSSHKIMSDRIVAGTFIIAAVMLNKKFEVKDIDTDDLGALIKTLESMGANLKIKKNQIHIMPTNELKGIKIETAPHPGFPTDLQAQIMALMSLAKGKSQIKENIFENRFMHVPELNRLGASIRVKKDLAFISGSRKFKGAQVMASDLRASVSLVLAALCAEGMSEINRVYHLDRGYEKIENTLGKLGPSIKRHKY